MRLLLVLCLVAVPAFADDGNWSASGGGGAGGTPAGTAQLLAPVARNTITGDDFFSGATDGVCFEDTDQCIEGDGAGGYEFKDELGNVVLTLSTAGVVTFTGQSIYSGVTTDITTGTDQDLTITPNGTGLAVFGKGIRIDGVATDITAASGEDLTLTGGASTGSVVLMSNDNSIDIKDSGGTVRGAIVTSSGNSRLLMGQSTNGGLFWSGSANALAQFGVQTNAAVTVMVASFADTIGIGGAGVNLISAYGGGALRKNVEQVITCAAGTAALDPQSSHISIDANGAACVVTIAETSAATIGPGFEATIYIATSAGAGAVTFPDVANVFNGPTLCTTTGLAIDGTMTIFYANKADDMFVATGCQTN